MVIKLDFQTWSVMSTPILLVSCLVGCAMSCSPLPDYDTTTVDPLVTTPEGMTEATVTTEMVTESTTTGVQRRKRAIHSGVIVILNTNLPYHQATNQIYLNAVKLRIAALAAAHPDVDAKNARHEAINYNGKFADIIIIPNASEKCVQVEKVVQTAVRISPETTSAQLVCGGDRKIINK